MSNVHSLLLSQPHSRHVSELALPVPGGGGDGEADGQECSIALLVFSSFFFYFFLLFFLVFWSGMLR